MRVGASYANVELKLAGTVLEGGVWCIVTCTSSLVLAWSINEGYVGVILLFFAKDL